MRACSIGRFSKPSSVIQKLKQTDWIHSRIWDSAKGKHFPHCYSIGPLQSNKTVILRKTSQVISIGISPKLKRKPDGMARIHQKRLLLPNIQCNSVAELNAVNSLLTTSVFSVNMPSWRLSMAIHLTGSLTGTSPSLPWRSACLK